MFYYTRARTTCVRRAFAIWRGGWIGVSQRGRRECALSFCLELGRSLSSVSVSLCCDDTMRHDTYLLRWRLQNTTTTTEQNMREDHIVCRFGVAAAQGGLFSSDHRATECCAAYQSTSPTPPALVISRMPACLVNNMENTTLPQLSAKTAPQGWLVIALVSSRTHHPERRSSRTDVWLWPSSPATIPLAIPPHARMKERTQVPGCWGARTFLLKMPAWSPRRFG